MLDTNVLSALMRRDPEPAVIAWIDSQPTESIWTTSITVFEVRMGLELLERGRRRTQLEEAFEQVLEQDLSGRVHAFDRTAAIASGHLAAECHRAGRPVEIRDLQIAGIATVRKATVATRNLRYFERLASVVDPWSS